MLKRFLLPTLLLAAAAHPFFAQSNAGAISPAAIAHDPPGESASPAALVEFALPSHGSPLLGVFYLAAGAAPHPTAIVLHGFPGYEQNLDLAQALRRAGWNVLALHYRGSWGTPGDFSIQHSIEDADAELAFALDPANASKYRIDTRRVVLIGHSFGGFLAASAAAHRAALPGPQPAGVVMISAWNIARGFEHAPASAAPAAEKAFLDDTGPADFYPLAGCTPRSLAAEIFAHRTAWNFAALAPALTRQHVLLITAEDGSDADSTAFLTQIRDMGNTQVSKQHITTDHPYSDRRIALETSILEWLAQTVRE